MTVINPEAAYEAYLEAAKQIETLKAHLAIERTSRAYAWDLAARLAREKLIRERRFLPQFVSR